MLKRGTNNSDVKKSNRNKIFRYVNGREKVSMPGIAAALGMSGPTVLQIVNELKAEKLLEEDGELESTGGRKAKAISVSHKAKYAVGIDITARHVTFVLTDLSCKLLKHVRYRMAFSKDEAYQEKLAGLFAEFIADSHLQKNKIYGAGISVPAIVDIDGNRISNSRALNLTDISADYFSECIPYPCYLLNDANAAAIAEKPSGRQERNMVYLSLSNTVGGAVIYSSSHMYYGDNWRSGEFGHMVIHAGGQRCYCGKQGCLDAYCSALHLSERTGGNLSAFFEEEKNGNPEVQKVWVEYLSDLVIAVDNLRMCYDCDVVLGGYVGEYMEPYLPRIRKMAASLNPFAEDGTYIKACSYRVEASALGAAADVMERFIRTI